MSLILSQAGKVRLRNKRVHFLGTANRIAMCHLIASYRRATMTGQMTPVQTKTVLLTNRILSQATEARLRYKCFGFLGTVGGFLKPLTSYAHLPFRSTHLAYHKPYLRVRAVLLQSSDTCPASVGFLQR